MAERLWAPWRLTYVGTPKPEGCVFCAKPAEGDDRAALVVARGELCYVVMNLFPYNNGHLLVVPYRHVADLAELTREESAEAQRLLEAGLATVRAEMGCEGANVGLNLGEAAGAGIAQHLHWHLVPRWRGDVNYMPVLADVKVMPQHLDETWQLLREGWQGHGRIGDDT